jgi:hypothetical protein
VRIALALSIVLALTRAAMADDDAKGEPGRPADKGAFGIGIILGEPTGISAKLYLRDDRAVDFAAGAAFAAGGLQLHSDYLFHPWILQDRDSFVLPVYLGPGARMIEYESGSDAPAHFAIGIRAVAGLLFDFKNVPLDVFLEVAIVGQYDFLNATLETAGNSHWGLAFNGGAGVRYYF